MSVKEGKLYRPSLRIYETDRIGLRGDPHTSRIAVCLHDGLNISCVDCWHRYSVSKPCGQRTTLLYLQSWIARSNPGLGVMFH